MDERDWLARRFEDHRGRLREEPVGGDLPDPVAHRGDGHDPEQQALAAEGVGLANPERLARVEPAPSTSSSV